MAATARTQERLLLSVGAFLHMAELEHSHEEHSHEHAHGDGATHGDDCCGHDHGHTEGHDHGHKEHSHKDSSAEAAVVDLSDAAEGLAVSKTDYSQQLKGSQSYYYWHGDAERRRLTGEQPVAPPLPKKLASSEVAKEKRIKAIEKHQFLDDSDLVKVYIPLDGELAGVTMDQVEAEFAEQSLMLTIETADSIFRFWIDRLSHQIDPLRCKAIIAKSGKLVVKLKKRSHMDQWRLLRG